MPLLTVREAQEKILAVIHPVEPTIIALERAAGRVLAGDIAAPFDFPIFDNSSMDGFAVRAADTSPAAPARSASLTLRVVADIAAGSSPARRLGRSEAARIMTGAPLPGGADAIIPVEDTDFKMRDAGAPAPEQVTIMRPARTGENVRPRGEDFKRGETILHGGQRLRAQDLGLLAMLGIAEVPVFRAPRVALFSSGDELVPVGAPLAPGQIHDSNSYALAAQIESCGAELIRLGVASDEHTAIQSLLDEAVKKSADMIVTSAGVSVGAFDFVKEAVESQGKLDFWKVNMRPGKPLAFGQYRGLPYIGLPGNPVSAFVTFEVFARPAIQRLGGETPHPRPRTRVVLDEAVESDGRESYLRAVVNPSTGRARLTGHQGSGNLLSLVQANALLIIPAGVKSRPAGEEVDAWLL